MIDGVVRNRIAYTNPNGLERWTNGKNADERSTLEAVPADGARGGAGGKDSALPAPRPIEIAREWRQVAEDTVRDEDGAIFDVSPNPEPGGHTCPVRIFGRGRPGAVLAATRIPLAVSAIVPPHGGRP